MVKSKSDMANSVISAYRIYIPIWLNSNKRQESKLFLNNLIYIPIWLNSNEKEKGAIKMKLNNLHSNMVKFKL